MSSKHKGAIPDEAPKQPVKKRLNVSGRPTLESNPDRSSDLGFAGDTPDFVPPLDLVSAPVDILLPVRSFERMANDMHCQEHQQGLNVGHEEAASPPRSVPPHPSLEVPKCEGREVGCVDTPMQVRPEPVPLERRSGRQPPENSVLRFEAPTR
jgi:hypothetical protein